MTLARAPATRGPVVSPRVRVLGAFGSLGLLATLSQGAPLAHDPSDLARALSQATAFSVAPEDLRWEPSRGFLSDAFCGRWLLFLARDPTTNSRDVWRARVRLAPSGRPVAISDAYNLTSTPLGDDHALVTLGPFAAFATRAEGSVQSVTLLDLSGEGAQSKAVTLVEQLTSRLTNLQQSGQSAGLGRFDLTWDQPTSAVGLALTPSSLALDLARPARIDHARFDLARQEANGVHVQAAMHLPKRLSHWAVDTVRAVPWIGPAPIVWLEDNVFALRDRARITRFKLSGASGQELAVGSAEPPAPLLDTSEASIEAAHWPPPAIAPIWKTPEAGEGAWVLPGLSWLQRPPGLDPTAPSAFFRTFLRPDEERPYAKVLLVAMDLRQLDLEMEAGTEDPQPLTGPHGPGRLPRDPAIFTRVVACFNGAFKSEHGHYGMVVRKRLLLPPQPGAATVITLKDGRVGLGSWGTNKTVGSLRDVPDDDIVSLRQNLDSLLDRGQVNPSGRSLWGFPAPGKGVQTERSGICVTTSGHLMYAWGDDVSATTLGKAMKMAGCEYGMHLDMNPYHTGFMFTNIQDLKGKKYKSELLSTGMEIPAERYIEWAPKDFFYVLVRDPRPLSVDGGSDWEPDPGLQPAPAWMPALWRTRLEGSQGSVELFDVEAGRVSWRIRAGTKDPPGGLRDLSGDEAKRVLLTVGLGATDRGGLGFDGRGLVPVRGGDDRLLLVARADGRVSLETTVPSGGDYVELPLLLDATKVRVATGGVGSRVALGVTAEGRLLVARGTLGSHEPLAEALKQAGCNRVVALEPGVWERAGTQEAPRGRHDEAVLYAVARPLRPRGFRFEAKK